MWKKLTSDTWILTTIKGYKIDFVRTPVQSFIPNVIDFGFERNRMVDQEVQDLLGNGAISECEHESGEFISNKFLANKKGSKFRPVINLKKLNLFIEYHYFKMENIDIVLKSIKRNSYFISCDLQNAYFSLPIHVSHRKYLRFEWNDTLYQFNCLCLGISCGPRVFTKLMKVIFAHIRRKGISSFYYIDDSLVQAESPSLCKQQSEILVNTLSELGFFINFDKSNLVPSTIIIY